MLALTACCEALILLSPPAYHYGYYDSKRSAIYSFVHTFFEAAAGAGEQLYVIADNRTWRDLSEEYGLNDAIVGVLDDIWIRDFFVTQLSDTTLVRFGYRPMYLNQQEISWIDHSARRFVQQIWPNGEVSLLSGNGSYPCLKEACEMRADSLVLDGGGIVWEPTTQRAVVTERVLRDNPWLVGRLSLSADGLPPRPMGAADPYAGAPAITSADLEHAKSVLERLLAEALSPTNASGINVTVAIVPEEPSAPRLGHVDGICNWLAPSTLALSNFSDPSTFALFAARLAAAFGDAVNIVPFPYYPSADMWEDGFESAEGVYVNFARTQYAIYVPTFGAPADSEALALAAEHADRPLAVVGVDARAVAIMGGSVRCLSTFLWGAFADTVTALRAPPPLGSPSPPPPAGDGVPVGIVAGATAGGVALIALVLVSILYAYKVACWAPKAKRAQGGEISIGPAL